MTNDSLVARLQRARAEVAVHKSAICRHRHQLRLAAAALSALEAECRRLGINPITATGEGVSLHGHHDERTRA